MSGLRETGESGQPHAPRFDPEEEATLVEESNRQKAEANRFFSTSQYSQAIGEYDKALSSCPNYLDYEIAVLKSNIAACHLKLDDWKAAINSATSALDALERLIPTKRKDADTADEDSKSDPSQDPNASDSVVELSGEDDAAVDAQLKSLELTDQRKSDIQRIRSKALMRRARAKYSLADWSNLQGAEDDYKTLSSQPLSTALPLQDRKIVQRALAELPPKIAAARESEMGEMMGKLKELGNGILKPFGLSTDNFKMNKDEKTGGYSMSFNQ
ncbi:hypothetical protein ACLMJK_003631 [Lecanora helva]